MMIKYQLIFLALLFISVLSLENGLGRTPQMGYNSWYDVRCSPDMNEKVIRQTVDAMISTGLSKLGYQYVNLDDCWAKGRYTNGTVYPDPATFPSGMKSLADYAHSKGLKFGVYTDRGLHTCAGRPGSGGYESLDAQTYASWGVDYLKEDSCFGSTDHQIAFDEYGLMRDSLLATGRPIFFSLCGWESWYAPVGATLGNSWRTGPDNGDWADVLTNININFNLSKYAGPGGWNDPCLLRGSPLTETQSRTQFTMWAIMASPLLLSLNIRNLSPFLLETYSNAEVIAINQDPLGQQGMRLVGGDLTTTSGSNVWGRRLSNQAWSLVFINNNPTTTNVTCDSACFQAIGLEPTKQYKARDLWLKKDLGTLSAPIVVPLSTQYSSTILKLTQ